MWNMAVNNISYPVYPFSTRTEKGYITKMIPFFFVQYTCIFMWVKRHGRGQSIGHEQKGLITGNVQMGYESSTSNGSKVMSKVTVC